MNHRSSHPRHQWPDAGQATIVIDRCIPPEGLGAAAHTIKSVLWCLRGLGHPGQPLPVGSSEVARRTRLTDRSVRRAIGCLCEAGVLSQTQKAAPGRQALYALDYHRLATWLDAEDQLQAGLNAGHTVRRTPDGKSAERRTESPPSGATPDSVSRTPDFESRTPDGESAVPVRNAGASCIPAKTCISISAAAADELRSLARKSGLSPEVSDSVARQLAGMGWTDLDRVRNDLERLAEAMARSSVRNPNGLLTTFLTGPLQPSDKALKRARKAEAAERKFQEFRAWLGSENRPSFALSDAIGRQSFRLAVETLGEPAAFDLMPEGRFKGHLCSEQETVQRFVHGHWETIRQAVDRERREAKKGQEVTA